MPMFNTSDRSRGRLRQILPLLLSPVAVIGTGPAGAATAPTLDELRSMSLEDLGDLKVASVSRRPESLSEAPGSIYVITNEAIRRAAAISLPEALRLAPNLIVARRDASHYAISARGFNSFEAANKLLVQIDGRSIYTALHGGVFWDQQQMPMADIDRIEVVSGPGGALWGANAFNGVVNVITKRASETQGVQLHARGGNVDQQVLGRYGGALGDDAHFRIYGMGQWRGETLTATGAGRSDDWNGEQGGFRFDWAPAENSLTVQGDIFDFDALGDTDISGYNVLARWERPIWANTTGRIRLFYDSVERNTPAVLEEGADAFDVDAKIDSSFGRHRVVFGAGHRITDDLFATLTPSVFVLDPEGRTVSITNVYAQDEISLSDNLALTIGVKYEHSSFSGGEVLPSARLAWQASDNAMFWSAISRAVRTPSRIDRDIVGPGILERATDFGVEELIAYEVGYRGSPLPNTLVSLSFYYNDYDDLRALTLTPGGLLRFGNSMVGHGYGVEAWADYQVTPWWRLSAGFNYLQKRLRLEAPAVPIALDQHAGNDPDFQAHFRSWMDVTDRLALDVGLRAVDDLEAPAVPGYVELDARASFKLTETVELAIAGSNLLHGHHLETGTAATAGEVRRSVMFEARLRF
jgi:iron complex outermembrane receptor protein